MFSSLLRKTMPDETEINPFASPLGTFEPQEDATASVVWAAGKFVCASPISRLPVRCVYCNQPGERMASLGAVWITFTRGARRVAMQYWMCTAHSWRRWILGSTCMLLVLIFVLSINSPWDAVRILGAISVLAAAITLVFFHGTGWFGRSLRIEGQTDDHFRISGCGRAFLDSLPTRAELNRDE